MITTQNNLPPCDDPRQGCLGLIIGAMLGLLFCSMFGSCSTPCTITEADSIHDTCFVERWQRDSVFIHDSTFCYIYTQNDTVYNTRNVYHTINKVQVKRDSIFINKTDTIVKTMAVPEKKQKNVIERAFDYLMAILALIGLIAIAVCVCTLTKK